MPILSTLLSLGAMAMPQGKVMTPRELLDQQHNSTGYPFSPNYPAGKPAEIVGGEIVSPAHKYPFLVSMQRNWPANPGPFCGASLVAP